MSVALGSGYLFGVKLNKAKKSDSWAMALTDLRPLHVVEITGDKPIGAGTRLD